jgi:transcriptional regulator with XRE-family HTH domain
MTPAGAVTEASEGVVALLLDDLAPPRLGTFLKGARKQGSLTRREVAGRVGTTSAELRRYERGDAPVPAHVIAALAECYGPDLTAQFATRVPLVVDANRMVAGADVAPLDVEGDDEELKQYAQLVQRVRRAQPGEPIGLRAGDLVALSRALGHDTDHIEARIVELLGCTEREARSLHGEIVRRKLVVPVAGLVAGLAVVTGVGVAAAATSPNLPGHAQHVATEPITAAVPTTAPPPSVTPPPATGPTDVAAPMTAATPTTAAPTEPPATPDVVPTTQAPTAEAPTTPAPAPTEAQSSDAPTTDGPAAATAPVHPVITTDTTPMSIPAHETVTVIQP